MISLEKKYNQRKKNVVIYLDPEVVKEAKDLGLNISKVSENALKEAIRRLKGENPKNILNSQKSDDSSSVNLILKM